MNNTRAVKKPINRWNKDWVSPGGVGPVGDALCATRLKRSCPEQAPAYRLRRDYGSNIVDGNNQAMYRKSAGARVRFGAFDRRTNSHKTDLTQIHPEDRTMMPLISGAPQYSWNNQVANAFRINSKELAIAPGVYGPVVGGVSRGPMPRKITIGQEVKLTGGYTSTDAQTILPPPK